MGNVVFAIAVYFVRCHNKDGPDARGITGSIQNIRGSHHICRESFQRVTVGSADESLRSHVDYAGGHHLVDYLSDYLFIANICETRVEVSDRMQEGKQGRPCVRGESQSKYFCTKLVQPAREPSPFEPRMPG